MAVMKPVMRSAGGSAPASQTGNDAFNGQVTNPNAGIDWNQYGGLGQTAGEFQNQMQLGYNNSDAGKSYFASQQSGPYRGGLLTNFGDNDTSRAAAADSDPDVAGAAAAMGQMTHGDSGTNHNEQAALYNTYLGRIGEKNTLANQIQSEPGLLNQEQDLNKSVSGQAMGQGLKNTRQNYNNRGLLYSGAREGGEEAVKTQGASNLAQAMAGTARDSANRTSTAQNAYAAVDLASAQDQLNRATNAFDTANANNIARTQAMQQLGSGLGQAAGTIAGSWGNTTPAVSPTTGWQPEQLQRTGLLSG